MGTLDTDKMLRTVLLINFIALAASQRAGSEDELHPALMVSACSFGASGLPECVAQQKSVVIDANWRWIHDVNSVNCYSGNQWSADLCPDPATCMENCVVEGASTEYASTYGVTTSGDELNLRFVTEGPHGTNVGSRLYLLDAPPETPDGSYQMFRLKNAEFTFDVDVSQLVCGLNGALYFVEMDADGGSARFPQNEAGAKYGTGYCDAQCPHDIKFISGEANVVDWRPNPDDLSNNMGIGKYGTCCAEMDIWEANSMATAYTPHPCDLDETNAQLKCEGVACGDNDKGERYDGVCDKDGCDINPYRMGNPDFYGRGTDYEINTEEPMTVVTQFLTTDGTDEGDLSEIRRFYVQNGNIIGSPSSTILGSNDSDSITDGFCAAKKSLFGDVNDFQEKGGNANMGKSLDRGQVLALSLWDDVAVNMLWLDSAYPLDKPVDDPGVKRGDCPGGVESTPSYLRQNFPDSYVTFQNVPIGEIGSTVDYSFPTQTPSLTPIATPTDAPVAAPGLCKNSCYNSSRPWEKLCQKEKCAGCPECTVSPTDAPVEPPV